MSTRNPRAKWVLPLTVNPRTHTDWCIPVPDDPFHRAAFLGALQNLGAAYKWQDDPAHTAKQVARVWRDIIDNLQKCMKEQPIKGYESEDAMPLRVDCDCNVYVLCCDGTEKQILTGDQVRAVIANPAVPGAPQPPAGGGCQDYSGYLQAGSDWLIPAPVSTGDTIEITFAQGATAGSALGSWACPDGSLFAFGNCIDGTGGLDAGDPMPAVFEGKLIMNLDGTYYDILGGVFTVPGGVSNVQPTLFINRDLTIRQSGTLQITVRVCNNALPSWIKTWNFALTPGSFGPWAGNRALWIPGTGWTPDAFPETQLISSLPGAFPAGVFFDEVDFTLSPAGTAEIAFYDGGAYHFDDAGVSSPHAYAHPVTAGWVMFFGATTAGANIIGMTIKGHGVNPF